MINTASPKIARPRRSVAATIAAAMSLAFYLGVCGPAVADPGWHVATSTDVGHDEARITNYELEAFGIRYSGIRHSQHTDPAMRIAIDQMLRETQIPLLKSPPPARQETAVQRPASTQPTVQPLSRDGWRPATGTGHTSGATGSASAGASEALAKPVAPDSASASRPPQSSHTASSDPATRNLGPLIRAAIRTTKPLADATTTRIGPSVDSIKPNPPTDELSLGRASSTEPIATTILDDMSAKSGQADDDAAAGTAIESKEHVTIEITDQGDQGNDEARMTNDEADPFGIRHLGIRQSEPVVKPLPPLTRNMRYLRNRVRRVLKVYFNKQLNSRDNDPWEMMHGMLAYGVHSRVRQGSPRGQPITLVGWLCYNKPCKGFTLLSVTPEGELRAKHGVGLQGHMGQFLAMLAQCKVSPDYPILVGEHEFTIRDLVEAEKITCQPDEELTFKLISLMHYLESDAKWVNEQGMEWDIEKLIREELAQPIRGVACGGTHRLAGLSLAARTRVRRGEPLDGEFARAAKYVEKYHNYAFRLQNRDGSLSTEWFRGRGDESDIDRRVKTTGHILEWLIYSLNDKQLRSSRTVRAVTYLANLLNSNYDHEWEVGPRSHAIHALKLYDQRVFEPYDDADNVANNESRQPATSRSSSRSRRQ